MRLIDADKLKAHYEWWDFSDDDDRRNKHIFDSIVDLQPTADVVSVVRCKDCAYGIEDDGWIYCHNYCQTERKEHFCADGERREYVEETDLPHKAS